MKTMLSMSFLFVRLKILSGISTFKQNKADIKYYLVIIQLGAVFRDSASSLLVDAVLFWCYSHETHLCAVLMYNVKNYTLCIVLLRLYTSEPIHLTVSCFCLL